MSHVFGPVPSRRLGQSLGLNNIPPKHCTYACVYCQLGDPQRVTVEAQQFFDPAVLSQEVATALESHAARTDYVTIVPDGEPTLDARLPALIAQTAAAITRSNAIHGTSTRLAVITNGTLMDRPEVFAALRTVDWVSAKVDAADEKTWRRIDRPARALSFETVIAGIRALRDGFPGFFATETMLVDGINTTPEQISALASLIAGIKPDIAYLSIPTRPPAETWVHSPEEQTIISAYQTFADAGITVELNIAAETGDFNISDELSAGILGISSVHPIRETDLQNLVEREGATWSVVTQLLESGELLEKTYQGERFYVARLRPERK